MLVNRISLEQVVTAIFTIATVLDPRFNILFYDQGGEGQDSVQAIKEVVNGVYKTFYHKEDDVSEPTPLAPMTMFSHLYPKKKEVSIDEFQSYISEPSLGEVSPSDMLLWWKKLTCQEWLGTISGTSASSSTLQRYIEINKRYTLKAKSPL